MNEIFYLDLHKNRLYGWERQKDLAHVTRMIDGIMNGDNFPPVPVHRSDDGRFFLSYNTRIAPMCPDGGHTRAIAHYRARKLLKCRRLEEEPPLLNEKDFYLLIRNIPLR